jgi:hypothetical protein
LRAISNLFSFFLYTHDGAEIFHTKPSREKIGKENIGLHREDGLAIIKNKSTRLADKTRKELHKTFEQFNLKITAEANLRVVNFLDVTFDLGDGKLKPYRKPNDDQICIDRQTLKSPTSIIKQLPTSINKRISLLSSNEQTFHETAPLYQNALHYSNFDHKLGYMKETLQQPHRNRPATQHHLV